MMRPFGLLATLWCALILLVACAFPTPTATPAPSPAIAAPTLAPSPAASAAPTLAPSPAQTPTPRAADTPTPAASAYDIRSVLPRDAIPSIDNPQFLDADAASEFMSDGHLVIGLSAGGEHRAYSTAFLSGHEIVNDTVGGAPVAVTW